MRLTVTGPLTQDASAITYWYNCKMQLQWNSMEEFLHDLSKRFSNRTALSHFQEGKWRTASFEEIYASSIALARSFQQSGLQPGDRVALLGSTSLDWPLHLFACALAGGIAFPIDAKLTPEEIQPILEHAEPRFLIVSKEFRSLAHATRLKVKSLEKVLYMEEQSQHLTSASPPPFPERKGKDCLAIFYTSGTLGAAKGVMVSYENIFAELTALTSLHENFPSDVSFSILPLNHLYGLTAGVLYSMACGSEYCFPHGLAPQDIALCLHERKVTQMMVVPLLVNMIRRGILKRIEGEKPLKRFAFRALMAIAPIFPLSQRRLLFGPIHKNLGGHLRRMVSGAAPLDLATYEFFRRIGIPVYEGYGLTETGPVICVNTTRRCRRGTVGRALPGLEIKVELEAGSDMGEIFTRGPHVMLGYYKNEEYSRERISPDGWFSTGDLGKIESNGYLRITGRKKSLIVLESGKKVNSEEVEQALQMSPNFLDVCVLGIAHAGQGELVTAVIHPTAQILDALPDATELQARIEEEVKILSKSLAAFKRPGKVIVRLDPLPKTTSGKVRRHLIQEELKS